MVALDMVRASNAQLKDLGPNLVAVFGIGPLNIGTTRRLNEQYMLTAEQWEEPRALEKLP